MQINYAAIIYRNLFGKEPNVLFLVGDKLQTFSIANVGVPVQNNMQNEVDSTESNLNA